MDLLTLKFIWQYGAWILFFLVCGLAVLKGGPTERAGAAIIAVSWGLWVVLHKLDGFGPGVLSVSIDVGGLIAFTLLAIRSRRAWVFLTAACTLNTLITHAVAGSLRFGAYSYVTVIDMWGSYAPLICLAFGVWGYRRMQKRRAATDTK